MQQPPQKESGLEELSHVSISSYSHAHVCDKRYKCLRDRYQR